MASRGSFRQDLDWLIEELAKPAIIELGKPAPEDKYLPTNSAAGSPAAHNRHLLDDPRDAL